MRSSRVGTCRRRKVLEHSGTPGSAYIILEGLRNARESPDTPGHAAADAMLTAGENIIKKVIAVDCEGNIKPPCVRCWEFMSQLADENAEAEVMVNEDTVVRLRDLLPFSWR